MVRIEIDPGDPLAGELVVADVVLGVGAPNLGGIDEVGGGAIAEGEAGTNGQDAARAVAALVTNPGMQMSALSDITVAQANAGDIAGARQAAEQMSDPYWRAVTLSHIIEVIMKVRG